jgi:hypothetical protein
LRPFVVPVVFLGVAALAFFALFVYSSRRDELFVISVRNGRLLLVRGHCPNPLFHDLEDVVHRAGVQRATIRAVKSDEHSRIVADGVDEGVAQRLRNAFGAHPIHLRRAPERSEERRNIGQWLGIAWLAWMLVD